MDMGSQGGTEKESLLAGQRHGRDGGAYGGAVTAYLVLSAVTAASIAFSSGCNIGYSSPTQSAIMDELGLSVAEFSLFGSLPSVGALLGGLLSGKMADFRGHIHVMWILSFLSILGWVAIALAKVPWLLYLGRLLLGFVAGVQNYEVPVYIAEISPKNLRGRFIALGLIAVILGAAFVYVLGSFVHWRTLALVGILINVLRLPLLFLVPESPTWLAMVGRAEDVASSLQCLRGKQADISYEATDIRDCAESLMRFSKGGFLDIFQRKYAKSLIIGIGLLGLQNCVGQNAYTFYSGVIFASAGASGSIGLISQASVQLLSGIVILILIDKFGRRPLLLVSAAGVFLGSFITGLSFLLQDFDLWKEGTSVLALISVLIFTGSFSLGLGGVPWMLVAEMFPMNIKGAAGSIGSVVGQLCGYIVSYCFNFGLEWSSAGIFFIFSAICAATWVFVAVLVPETKGRSPEEIQESLAHPLRNNHEASFKECSSFPSCRTMGVRAGKQ